MAKYILAIDQGTTGSTALILDPSLKVLGRGYQEFRQIYPQSGWVEHDPRDILASVEGAVRGALGEAAIQGEDIKAIGITNQRETTVLWDRQSHVPLMNAIVWQDRRTDERCRALKAKGLEATFKARTGLVLDPYFSGTKISWMLDSIPGARKRAEGGKVAFGTIDSYLVHHLSGGGAHVTDVTNASRTLLMDLKSLSWDEELAGHLNVPMAVLPDIRGCSEIYAHTKGLSFLPDGIPLAGMAGDQHAALFGQLCLEPGMAKCTYGTGAFLLMNTGSEVIPSESGLLTTLGWKIGDKTTYALEGSAFIAGAAVQWLRDGLGLIKSAKEIEGLAAEVPDSGGVTFVPALAGLGAPHWRPEARGVISGLSRGTTKHHLARATLEGIALQIRDLTFAMSRDLGKPLAEMRVDGGAAANNLLMQMQADFLQVPLVRPRMLDTTALGAGLFAGLATGVWQDLGDLKSAWEADRTFHPQISEADLTSLLSRWERALERA